LKEIRGQFLLARASLNRFHLDMLRRREFRALTAQEREQLYWSGDFQRDMAMLQGYFDVKIEEKLANWFDSFQLKSFSDELKKARGVWDLCERRRTLTQLMARFFDAIEDGHKYVGRLSGALK